MSDPARRRTRFHTQVTQDVQDRARAAVRGVSAATGTDYTLAALVEDALEKYCEHLERVYNDGHRWPTPAAPLRPGRRLPGGSGHDGGGLDGTGQRGRAAG